MMGNWLLGLPNSSSHALICALIGIAAEKSLNQRDGWVWRRIQRSTLWQIATAQILTRPATIALSGGLFYLMY